MGDHQDWGDGPAHYNAAPKPVVTPYANDGRRKRRDMIARGWLKIAAWALIIGGVLWFVLNKT